MQNPSFKYLILAMRPATLLVGLSPVFLGTYFGMSQLWKKGQELSAVNFIVMSLAVLLVILMQCAANLVNDVKDFEKGVDTLDRVGPPRYAAEGLLPASTIKKTYRLFFVLAMIISSGLAFYGGMQTILLGLLCCLFAFLYTGGPFPLSHIGLGELVAFVFFGPVAVGGSAFLQTLTWDPFAILLGCAPGFLASAVMAVNNYRDLQTDAAVGKKTLATRLSPALARALPWMCILAALAFLFAPYLNEKSPRFAYLAVVCCLVLYISGFQLIKKPLYTEQGLLNLVLKRIAIFEIFYTISLVGIMAI